MTYQIASIILWLLQLLTFALIGRALLSWFDPGLRWPISQALVQITEPLIAPIRRGVPSVGMFDPAFLVAIMPLQVLQRFLQTALGGY